LRRVFYQVIMSVVQTDIDNRVTTARVRKCASYCRVMLES